MGSRNLLIVGAGSYAVVAYEIAKAMQCFGNIAFVDDNETKTPNNIPVIGITADILSLADDFSDIIVAIGNSDIRLDMLKRISDYGKISVCTLISPDAHISASAEIKTGTIIEPMAVVSSLSKISQGCIISAGAVIGHDCLCCEGVHVDFNATVAPYSTVPAKTKVNCGSVYC